MTSNMNHFRRRASSHASVTSKIEHDPDRRRITLPTLTPPSTRQTSIITERDPERRRITLSTLSPSLASRQTSISFCNLQSQWEILMRKFSQDCKGTDHYCALRSDGEPMTCESRPLKKFSTGSTYEGTWDALGMCGYGTYTFPNGVVYRGEFEDNMFHGDGEMRYPDGTTLRGKWNYGDLIDRTVIFEDGVHYSENNWKYCKDPDRRFSCEYKDGIQAGGNSYMTAEKTLRMLTDGTYDTGNGIYDPKTGTITDYNDNTRMISFPSKDLRVWIEENCRKAPDDSLGPQPDLYKHWLDVKLKTTAPPPPECISDEDSDPNDIYANENYPESSSSMMRSRPSLSSYAKRSKLKFDPHKPQVEGSDQRTASPR